MLTPKQAEMNNHALDFDMALVHPRELAEHLQLIIKGEP